MNMPEVYAGLTFVAIWLVVKFIMWLWYDHSEKAAQWRAMRAWQAVERAQRVKLDGKWYFDGEDK